MSITVALRRATSSVVIRKGIASHQGFIAGFADALNGIKMTNFSLVNAQQFRGSHFKSAGKTHPLKPLGTTPVADTDAMGEVKYADHVGRQQNHIWTETELVTAMTKLYHYSPKKISDYVMQNAVLGLYHTFNFLTSYKFEDPSVKSVEWRLIMLESVAGVPGFVAAGIRHFRSLRTLQRDHGWIVTLLEEAENERMHLMVCLDTFKAGFGTRMAVIAVQAALVPILFSLYVVHPKSVHRFVGYLEETACKTYLNVIDRVETPGTQLHEGWATMAAPENAIGYWKMPTDAKWIDALKCMMADETHHRDVNHTFADMKFDDPNPFVEMHKNDAMFAWRLNMAGEDAWKPKDHTDSVTYGKAKEGLKNLTH